MTASPSSSSADKELMDARKSFHIARAELDTTLKRNNGRDTAVDRLVYHADDYGLDLTLDKLTKAPATFDLDQPLSETALSAVCLQLRKTYDAMHRLDLAMAETEDIARKQNPDHVKAILIGGREYTFDPAANTLKDRNTGDIVRADYTFVASGSGGKAKKLDRDRDR